MSLKTIGTGLLLLASVSCTQAEEYPSWFQKPAPEISSEEAERRKKIIDALENGAVPMLIYPLGSQTIAIVSKKFTANITLNLPRVLRAKFEVKRPKELNVPVPVILIWSPAEEEYAQVGLIKVTSSFVQLLGPIAKDIHIIEKPGTNDQNILLIEPKDPKFLEENKDTSANVKPK
jgi:hypothetical protein